MKNRLSFHDQIQSNKIKSVVLMFSIIVVLIILGFIVAQLFDPSFFFFIMVLSIFFSISYTILGYYNADKIALASVKAKPASPTRHKVLFDVIENMALASGLPLPRAYIMDSPEINAFASGRNPENSAICVTTGALEKLNKQELEGVIAHEMAHIANFDIRFMTLSAVLIGMIAIVSELFLRSLWFADDERGKSNGILLLMGIALAILAPLLSRLVAMAISRKREYLADATGVQFTRYPPGLANALKKIKRDHVSDREKHAFSHTLAPLFITDPFKKFVSLFATHPPLDERIRRLEAM